MGVRNIKKQLAGVEDLLLGEGTQVQERNSGSVPITKINLVGIANTVEDLATLDVTKYTTAIVKDPDRGGTFIWSATGTANGGTVFAGATGFWNRQYSGAVNVMWFGANINAVDNYEYFVKALAYCAPLTSGVGSRGTEAKALYVPNSFNKDIPIEDQPRYFNVGSQLIVPNGVSLEGDGILKSGLYMNAWTGSESESAIVFTTNSTNTEYGLSKPILRDISIIGAGTFDTLIEIERSDNSCSIVNSLLKGSSYSTYSALTHYCVKINSGTNFKTDNLYCSGAKENIVTLSNLPISEVQPISDVVDSHITFNSSYDTCGYSSIGGIHEIYSGFSSEGVGKCVVLNKSLGVPKVSLSGIVLRGNGFNGAVYSMSSYNASGIFMSFAQKPSTDVLMYISYNQSKNVLLPNGSDVFCGGYILEDEGTWIPTLTGSATAGSPTYTLREGIYSKIGKTVTFSCYIDVSTLNDSAGEIRISGLPFSSAGTFMFPILSNNAAYTNGRLAKTVPSASYIRLLFLNTDDDAFYVWCSGSYITND